MAPTKSSDPSPEYAKEQEEFLDALEKYHEKRGCVFGLVRREVARMLT